MLLASLILHASIAEITAQLLSLYYVYFISSDEGSIISIFVQINILEGRAGYVVLMQGSLNLILEGRCHAEFSSNLPQHTCLEVSSVPSQTLISCFRCV